MGHKISIWLSGGGPILEHFLFNSSIYDANGVPMEAPKYAFRKVCKKRWFEDLSKQWKWCSRQGGSAISSEGAKQLSDLKMTSFLLRPNVATNGAQRAFWQGPKKRHGKHENWDDPPPRGRGGQAFELSWGSAAQATNHKGNQYWAAHNTTDCGKWHFEKLGVLHFGLNCDGCSF